MPLTKEEIAGIVDAVRTAVTEDIATAVTAAVKPVQDGLASVRSQVEGVQATVTTVQTESAAARTAADAAATAQASEGARAAVQGLVDSCRLADHLAEATVKALLAMPPAERTSYLETLRKAPPLLGAAARSVVVVGSDGKTFDAMNSLPPSVARELRADGSVDAEGIRFTAQAILAAGGLEAIAKDPARLLTEATRLNGGVPPWVVQ